MQHGGTFTAGQAQYADVNGDGLKDLILQSNDNRFFVSTSSTGSGFTAAADWGDLGGSFTPGQAQYADVNGDGRFDLLFQASDNKEYLSLSSGSNFGAPRWSPISAPTVPSSPEPCTSSGRSHPRPIVSEQGTEKNQPR
jgi:hypothetical protein